MHRRMDTLAAAKRGLQELGQPDASTMQLSPTTIPGCWEIHYPAHSDARGNFVKTYQFSTFGERNLEATFVEVFYTISGKNVLRGMHIQLPPADGSKLVYCIAGRVMDVVLDLRRGSPTFGRYAVIELAANKHNAAYLSRGVAHGFYVREAPALMVYHITAEYVPELDTGIAWNSFGAPWPHPAPLISQRDASLPAFQNFDSPFQYTASPARQDSK
jgi:dTDP-4-dehydrorhamnose 3,5-epimerase